MSVSVSLVDWADVVDDSAVRPGAGKSSPYPFTYFASCLITSPPNEVVERIDDVTGRIRFPAYDAENTRVFLVSTILYPESASEKKTRFSWCTPESSSLSS